MSMELSQVMDRIHNNLKAEANFAILLGKYIYSNDNKDCLRLSYKIKCRWYFLVRTVPILWYPN